MNAVCKAQQGNILVVSLGILLMMTFLGIGLFYKIDRSFKSEESGHEHTNTFNAAQTGIQIGMFWLEDAATRGNYPDRGDLDSVGVPSLVTGSSLSIAKSSGCHGYGRFIPLNLTAGGVASNAPSTDLSTPLNGGLRQLSSAPTGVAECTIFSVDGESTLGSPNRLSTTLIDFYVEALPTTTAEAVGQQVGVSSVYGYSGANTAYPYRIRAVGRHHPDASTPFDPTDDQEARFDKQSVVDLWVHYGS